MFILTVIEERWRRLEESASLSKLGNRGSMELRRLECSLNFDVKGES
jgi:hypothetical protein